MRAGKVVSGTVGIVHTTVPFHGEHDAQEPTKVQRGQGEGRATASAPELCVCSYTETDTLLHVFSVGTQA